jgi:amphiphysin
MVILLFTPRLNIFYVFLEKINTFAEEGKFDVTNTPGEQIAADYEQIRTDAWKKIEDMNIIKRIILVSVGT